MDTNFIPQQTVIGATWLNDVNKAVYRAIGTGVGGTAPATPADMVNFTGLKTNSISALRLLDKTRVALANVLGYYAPQDGGGGLYALDPVDATTPDNGGTVIVAADGGRWKLQFTGQVSIKQFGAKGDGVANDTAAIQSAINSVPTLYCPDGTYLIDTVFFPNSPSDQNPVGGRFIGSHNVIFLQNTANTALFKKVQTAGRAYNWEIGPFCVKPKAGASSTVSAVFESGFTSSKFNHIQGLSNGTAGFYAIFDCSASPYLAYFNTFNEPTLEGQQGYTKVFHFNNNGAGTAFNSNANTINRPSIYNNTGLAIAIDAYASYAVTINEPYIEANPACLAINMGQTTVVVGGALEQNGTGDFNYTDAGASFGVVMGTSLATAHNVNFGNGAVGNLWLNVTEINPATWTNLPDVSNKKIRLQANQTPNAPALNYVSGGTGVITTVSAVVQVPLDPISGEVTYRMQYNFAAAGTSTTKVALASLVPFGSTPAFAIKDISWGVITAAGLITPQALDADGGLFFAPPSATNILINCFVTFKQPL